LAIRNVPVRNLFNIAEHLFMAEDKHEHLYDLVKDFDNAMLVTKAGNGQFHARPMHVAELQRDADAYFATSIASSKIAEVEANPEVLITFQSSSQFAAISGMARLVRDRATIDRLWSDAWKAWFPGGKDDPSLCLLRVEAKSGEFWDNSGMKGIRYFIEGVKAVIQGEKHDVDADQHGKVSL
jgi:general stress protein 26